MNWFSASAPQPAEARREPHSPQVHQERCDVIRSAMLECLAGLPCPNARALMLRIHCAGDAEHLWYLRPETMSVLASRHGEALARQTLARISVLFQDVLPEGLASQLRAVGRITPSAQLRAQAVHRRFDTTLEEPS